MRKVFAYIGLFLAFCIFNVLVSTYLKHLGVPVVNATICVTISNIIGILYFHFYSLIDNDE